MRTDAEILSVLRGMTETHDLVWVGGEQSWYEADLGKAHFRLIPGYQPASLVGVLEISVSGKPVRKIFEPKRFGEFQRLVNTLEIFVHDPAYEELEKELEAAFNEAGY